MPTALSGTAMVDRNQAGESRARARRRPRRILFSGAVGVAVLAFAAPPLAKVAIRFGAPEMFLLTALGLFISQPQVG